MRQTTGFHRILACICARFLEVGAIYRTLLGQQPLFRTPHVLSGDVLGGYLLLSEAFFSELRTYSTDI